MLFNWYKLTQSHLYSRRPPYDTFTRLERKGKYTRFALVDVP